MKVRIPFVPRPWMIAPALACVFLTVVAAVRIKHLDYLAEAGGVAAVEDSESPTGYAGGLRTFIPAARDAVSLEPVAQTQQMLARGDFRIRHVDYDNAPGGRMALSPSPYLWWLGAVSSIHSLISGLPTGAAVERAALIADPLLHILAIFVAAAFVARRYGTPAAAAVSVGMALLVPFAGAFAPGQPRIDGLAAIAAFWSVLLVLAAAGGKNENARRGMFTAGIAGGTLLWLDTGSGTTVLAGIVVGALVATFLTRKSVPEQRLGALPWRHWAVGGGLTCILAYAIEFLPGQAPGLRLDVINPLHGLAWLGIAEFLTRLDRWVARGEPFKPKRELIPLVLILASIAVPLVLVIMHRSDWFGPDPSMLRLTTLSESAVASGLFEWLAREGFSMLAVATILPVAIVAPLLARAIRFKAGAREGTVALLAIGATAATLVIAWIHLRRWVVLDGVLLAGLVPCVVAVKAASASQLQNWARAVACAVLFVPGVFAIIPKGKSDAVSESELTALIERDLAHWLSRRAGEGHTTVLASPRLAASLAFEGGFKALGSPYPENRAGFDLSLRIAGTGSQDEAHALITNRGITHVVLASWDTSLEEFAKLGDKDGGSLMALLHQWLPPRWLRPVPYPVPQVPGAVPPTVLVFEVVELQDNSVALSVLAEYFVETGRIGLAGSAAEALGRLFPEDIGAQVARVRGASAAGDRKGAQDAFNTIITLLDASRDDHMPWERRVSLSVLLAEAKRFDLAQGRIERCVAELDESRLRGLTPATLHKFVTLADALGIKPDDEKLWKLAHNLVSPEGA